MNVNWILPVCAFLSVASIAFWSFVAVAAWSEARRREREAYYKSETLKKIAESSGAGGSAALEFLREEERIKARHLREGHKLGGLITAAVGIALMILLRAMPVPAARSAYLVGLIPVFTGVAILVYAYFLAPNE